jgi:hypothetical protein
LLKPLHPCSVPNLAQTVFDQKPFWLATPAFLVNFSQPR